jgi:hypothetical protein
MTPAIAIAKLASMGLPADKLEEAAAVIDAVVRTALVGEEDRKARDRDRKARKSEEKRGRDRNSAEVPGTERNGPEQSGTKSAVDIITNTNLDNNTPSQQQHRSTRTSRGTRLPEDFRPIPNILELARNLGFTDAEYWDHFERFCDYWRGVSGAKGVKLDWQGTWRNRIKDIADRLKKGSNGQNRSTISTRFDAIRASIEGGGDEGDTDRGEDPLSLPRLRKSA